MSELYIRGGTPLEGELTVQGAKNSALPSLAACLLARGPVRLTNCPCLSDVSAALDILAELGCRAEQEGHTVTVDAAGAAGMVFAAFNGGALSGDVTAADYPALADALRETLENL